MKRIAEGLQIFLSYNPDATVSGDNDKLYADGPPPKRMRPAHPERLKDLGWVWDEKFDSWSHFI